MNTDREIAIARAIDRASALDIMRLVNAITWGWTSDTKWVVQKALLNWSEDVVIKARDSDKA